MGKPIFQPLPDKPDHPGLEQGMLAVWEAEQNVREAARAEQRRPDLLLHGRAGHREPDVARRAHGLGTDAEGRLPALQGAARLRPALSERLRLSGPLDRGRSRALARAELEARDRGVRPRRVRAALPGGRRRVVGGAHTGVDSPRAMDGLGSRLLHLQRHEHRVHLEVPQDRPRSRLALHGAPLHGMVSPLRHVALAARADAGRRLPGSRRPVALCPLPSTRRSSGSRSSSGRRRRGRCRPTSRPRYTPTRSTGGARTASGWR